MRLAVTIPISVVAGVAAGILVFPPPRHSASNTARVIRVNEKAAEPAIVSESTASIEVKTQRLVEAIRESNRSERENEMYLAIQAFTAEDLSKLLGDKAALRAMIREAAKGNTSWNLMLGLISRWLELDPNAAIAWIPQAIDLYPRNESSDRHWIVQALAKKMPAELLAQTPSCKDAEERALLIEFAMRELAARDSAKARAWLDACTEPSDRPVAEKAFRLGLVKADPLQAIELADSIENRSDADQLLRTAATSAAEMGPGMLRQLVNLPMKPSMTASLLGELAKLDPDQAMEVAMNSRGEGRDASGVLSIAFGELAKRDPEKCIAKLDNLEGAERAAAVSAIGRSWAAQDPAAALSWLMQRPIAERNDLSTRWVGSRDTLLQAFSDWMDSTPAKARAWADALPAGATRDSVQSKIARTLATRGEPAEATQILARLGQAAEPTAVTEIAGAWARKDPQAAADWALAQDAGPTQSRALAGIVGAWANDDQAGVENWLSQFPPGEARDRSVKAFLWRQSAWTTGREQRIAEFDAWFDLIDDPWQRAAVARSSFYQRKSLDPAAARTWLSSLQNVDPEVIRTTLRDNGN